MSRKKKTSPKRPKGPTEIPKPREERQILTDLATLCSSPGFIHAIAYFCFRDNFVRYAGELTPDVLGRIRSGSELIRTEISTLIGLLARQPIDITLPSPEVMQRYIDHTEALLEELHQALASVWFKDFDLEKAKAGQFDPFSSAAAWREPIFYGGDSAYNFQYREFAAKKYIQDKSWLEANKGFNIDVALSVANVLRDILTEKQSALRDVLRTRHPAEWTMLPAFCFSRQEIVSRSGMNAALVERVICAFCFPKEDRNEQFTALQEYNATNAMPILQIGDDNYALLQHYSLLEAIYESPFFWMVGDEVYAPEALSNRGDFTESLMFERFRKVFGPHVHANVHIERTKGDELGEIDVLVMFGDRAIVLQAKSKRLTLEAQKGNDSQLKSDFKRAVQDAYDQALACSRALIEGNCKLVNDSGIEIKPPTPIKEVFPVCVVADHYPALAFQARHFLKAEETDEIRAPLVTDVFALDAITEMLDTPLRLLSYLMLRGKFGGRLLSTHEFTLLSMHLKHNLWINKEYNLVVLEDDISSHLDAAMIVRREGLLGARTPDGVLTRMKGTYAGRILSEIESRSDAATISLGFLLLSLSEDSLETINQGIGRIVKEAASDGKKHDFTVSFSESSSGITIHCNNEPREEAADSLHNHCELRKYSEKARCWFGLFLWPKTGTVRFGLTLDYEWRRDHRMDVAIRKMRQPLSPKELRRSLRTRKKVGRNEPCPCGSGRKFKKCCERRGGSAKQRVL